MRRSGPGKALACGPGKALTVPAVVTMQAQASMSGSFWVVFALRAWGYQVTNSPFMVFSSVASALITRARRLAKLTRMALGPCSSSWKHLNVAWTLNSGNSAFSL